MKTLYVSILDGDDAWTGANPDSNTSGTGPFKTIQRARDIAATTPLEYTKIIIREGTYTFTTPFILTSSNSGNTLGAPLTFKAYDDEIVKLCAATSLNSTLFSLVTAASDSAIYNRLNTSAKGKVYVYNLGVGFDVGNFTTYWCGAWLNQADQLTNTYNEYLLSSKYFKGSDLPPLPEISIDGELLTLARWPSTGYAEMKSVIEAGSSGGSECDCVGDATTTCVGKTPCYDQTSDLCNYKYYTGTNAYLNNRIPKIPWGIDGIFEYDSSYDSIIAKWPNPSTYEMYIYGPVSFDFSAEGMKILEINKTNRTIKVNSHRSKYGIVQFNDACYGRAYSTSGPNCTCKNSSGVETIPLYTQPVYDSPTCLATSSKQESNDNLATRKLSSSPQRWRQEYWSDPHPRRWFALNILEELNSAGQYYIDRATKKLYVWSKTPITSSSKVLISKVSGYASDNKQTAYESDRLQSVIKITGASNIKFENIEICDTSGHGIDIIRSNNITLKNCNIYNTRKTGIRILGGTSNNVDGCNIFDTGTGGVKLCGGNKITLEPSKHIIQNCDITRTCLNIRGETMVAAIQMHGVGNTIRKNKIYNLSSQAIGHSGNNNIIEYNNIHDVIIECDDCGAIYTWANISNRGNICRYNLFRNIQNKLRAVTQFPSANANSCNSNPTSVDPNGDSNAMKDGWFGHCAIYFDNFAGGMTITGNIFYRCGNKNGKGSMGAIFINYGIDVIASNNIFVDCPLAVGSNPNRPYYANETTEAINDRQISTGGNESWEVALNDKPSQYNDSGVTPCCRTPTPGNFNGWSVLLNWNGITLGTANDVAFIQNPKLFEYNYKELGYIIQCDIRSTVYTNQYPELLGIKSSTPTSFLYFDTTEQKLKVNANYPRKNYADRNVFVQTPYKTSTYSSWNQVIKTWDTTNDQVITKIEDAGFIDIAAGDFSLSPNSPILTNILFDPIPVQYIAGYYEETAAANEVTVNIADLTINQDRQDFGWVDITNVDRLYNTIGIKPESKYLKSHPKTKKLILCYMPWSVEGWDVNGNVVPYYSHVPEHTDEYRLNNYKTRLDLTKTVEGLLRAAATEYNTYITNLNNDTVGGTKPVTEHMGEIPLITYDIENPCYLGVLADSNTRQWADRKYGAGTWQFCIDFLANIIPKSKELVANPAFRAANNIPEIFTKAKFSHYAMPHTVFGVSFCEPRTTSDVYDCNRSTIGNAHLGRYIGWHEMEDDVKQQRRNMLMSDEYFGKIMRTCDWFCPPVYLYHPDQDGTIENPANCFNNYVHRKNKYGRNWQDESHYQNVLIFKEFNSKEGIEKDIYPMLGHIYLGGSYFEQSCTNLKYDSTNPSKLFWTGRKTTPEDVARIMELAIQAGTHSIKGFTYWSNHYGYNILHDLDGGWYCDINVKYHARAIYSRDIDSTKLPFILDEAYWQSKTCLTNTNTTTTNIFEAGIPATNTPYNNFILSNLLSHSLSGFSSQSNFATQVKRNSNTLSTFSSNPIDNTTSTQTQRQTDPQGDEIVPVSNSIALYKLTDDFHEQIDIYRTNTFSSLVGTTNGSCVTIANELCSWANDTCWNNYCNGNCVCSNGDPTACNAIQTPKDKCCRCKQFCIDNDFIIPASYKNAEWPDDGKHFCVGHDELGYQLALCYECGVDSCGDYGEFENNEPLGQVINGKFSPVWCSDLKLMAGQEDVESFLDLTDANDSLNCIYNDGVTWTNDYVLNVDNESIPGHCLIQGCYCGSRQQTKPCGETIAYVRDGITYYCPNTSGVTPVASCGEPIIYCKPPFNSCCNCQPNEFGPCMHFGDCITYFNCVNNTAQFAPRTTDDPDGGGCDRDVCEFTCDIIEPWNPHPCSISTNCYPDQNVPHRWSQKNPLGDGGPKTSADYLNCINNCPCKACCGPDPCASITTQSFWPITTIAKYDACKSSTYGSGTCCGSFDCSWCGTAGKGRCDNTDIRCTNPTSTGTDCCVCNNPDGNCLTNTAALFTRCQSSCSAASCCVDPCPPNSSITTLAQYKSCIATYGGIGCLCGGMKCSYCGASPYCSTPSDILCTNPSNKDGDCCICNNTTCATDTIVDYDKCIGKSAAPTCADTSCCINPCTINGSSALSQITTVALYDQCIAKTGIFTGLKDNACCGVFQCSYCGATVCSSTDTRCKNTASPNSDCCVCNNTNCATTTASEYITCLSSCASSACCTNPCISAPTNYFDCIGSTYFSKGCCAAAPVCSDCLGVTCTSTRSFCSNSQDIGGCCACKNAACATANKTQYDICKTNSNCTNNSCCTDPCIGAPTNYFDCIGSAYFGKGCCAAAPMCSDCGSSPCTSTHSFCSNSEDIGGCCACKNAVCATATKTQYNICRSTTNCTNNSCCTDPCIGAPTNYFDCIGSTYFAKGCCAFSCADCGSSPCTSPHTECSSVGCCACTDPACASVTKTQYDNCITNVNCTNASCCVNPCIGAPTNYFDCIVSPYMAKGCCAAAPMCSDCGSSPCTSTHTECSNSQDIGGCCACKNAACATANKTQYDICKSTTNCTSNSCCVNPCIGAPTNYFDCIVSPYFAKGCCAAAPTCLDCGSSPCISTHTECSNSQDIGGCCACKNAVCATATKTQYETCKTNSNCANSSCCTDPCIGVPTNYFDCIGSTYFAKGCCAAAPTCLDCVCNIGTTLSDWQNCISNDCCKNLGCCGPNPCTGCSSDYRTCIKSDACKNAGCCNITTDCDLCSEDRLTCWKTCGATGGGHCCPGGPCDGCLNPLDGSTWYSCITNPDCVELSCCGTEPCARQKCFSSTKTEYLACINSPACNSPIQDPLHPCCSNPCDTCPTNYFECVANSPCLLAGCCPSAPSCGDCDSSPCTSTHIECSNSEDTGGCCACKNAVCSTATKTQYDICRNNTNCTNNSCCVNPCIGAPTNYFDCIGSAYFGKGCCAFSCVACGSSPCTSTHAECSNSEDTGGCCACKNAACATSNKTEYNNCIKNANCTNNSCCVDPCLGAPTNYFDCIVSPYFAKGCCAAAPMCSDCIDPCGHVDPRCSNATDHPTVKGCCRCKDARCADSTRSQYLNCTNKTNGSWCAGCCDYPCTGCGKYKTSEYNTCIAQPNCHAKGCCNAPALNPCSGCNTNPICSNDAICVKGNCCRSTPPCELCSAEYTECSSNNTCRLSGCCPPNPCDSCNRLKTIEGYDECSADDICMAYNCCNDPCESCKNMYYTECLTDVYCQEMNCCPPEPCPTCPEDYQQCISNDICRLYCCCKDV